MTYVHQLYATYLEDLPWHKESRAVFDISLCWRQRSAGWQETCCVYSDHQGFAPLFKFYILCLVVSDFRCPVSIDVLQLTARTPLILGIFCANQFPRQSACHVSWQHGLCGHLGADGCRAPRHPLLLFARAHWIIDYVLSTGAHRSQWCLHFPRLIHLTCNWQFDPFSRKCPWALVA